jgi:hypothetical protein
MVGKNRKVLKMGKWEEKKLIWVMAGVEPTPYPTT